MLRRNSLLEHVMEGKIQGRVVVTGIRLRGRKQLLYELKAKKRILEIERGSTGSHSVENSLCRRLSSCCKTG
jgi:hypothetical protein